MDLLANDLSVHEQFHDLAGFREALSQLMAMRVTARRYGREVQCNRMFLNTTPIPEMPMQQAIGHLGGESQRRAVMSWLTRTGPFWDDVRRHGEEDWLKCDGEIVTDTAAGEAAFRILHGVECGLVSLAPSEWCYSPLQVTWVRKPEELNNRNAPVENWWRAEALDAVLQDRAPPLASWDALRRASSSRFARLSFAEECFALLAGVPFAKSAADRFLALLRVLDRLRGRLRGRRTQCGRTSHGHRLLHRRPGVVQRFVGDRKAGVPPRADLHPSRGCVEFAVLLLARQGLPPDAPAPLLLARRGGAAGVRGVRRPQDHEAVSRKWRRARSEPPCRSGGATDLGG